MADSNRKGVLNIAQRSKRMTDELKNALDALMQLTICARKQCEDCKITENELCRWRATYLECVVSAELTKMRV